MAAETMLPEENPVILSIMLFLLHFQSDAFSKPLLCNVTLCFISCLARA